MILVFMHYSQLCLGGIHSLSQCGRWLFFYSAYAGLFGTCARQVLSVECPSQPHTAKCQTNTRTNTSLVRSSVRSFVRSSFVRVFVPLFVRWIHRSFVRAFVCSFVRSLVRSSVRPSVRSLVRSFVRSFVRSVVRSSPFMGWWGTIRLETGPANLAHGPQSTREHRQCTEHPPSMERGAPTDHP